MGQGLMAKDTEGVDSGDIASGDVSGAMLLQPPTVEDVRKCQFHCWYPKFSPKYVGKVESLVLEDDFVSYLKQDGISVPKTSRVVSLPPLCLSLSVSLCLSLVFSRAARLICECETDTFNANK